MNPVFASNLEMFNGFSNLKGTPRVDKVGVRVSKVPRPTPYDYEVYAIVTDGVDVLGEISALMSRTPSMFGTPGVMDPDFFRPRITLNINRN